MRERLISSASAPKPNDRNHLGLSFGEWRDKAGIVRHADSLVSAVAAWKHGRDPKEYHAAIREQGPHPRVDDEYLDFLEELSHFRAV